MESNYCSPEINELAKAMKSAQEKVNSVKKNLINEYKGYHYASLSVVMEECKKALADSELWLTQFTLSAESGSIHLVTRVYHIPSTQWQESHLIMPAPRTDPQGYGSALTYARRYALQVVMGMVCEDDDGAKACDALKQDQQAWERPQGAPQVHANPQNQTEAQSAPLPESVRHLLAVLPPLNGVKYEPLFINGGYYIHATGNTSASADRLEKAGFQRGKKSQSWYLAAKAA